MPTRDPLDRPNVVLINCDDLGWGDLGCTGHGLHRTPHLDRLASGGMTFTDFCQPSSVCSPSRGAMLTGCYPKRIGFSSFEGKPVLFPGQAVGLNPDEITFAALLQRQGYATAMVGKWHCGDQPAFLPTRHGFDRYFGLPYSNDMGRQGQRWNPPPLPLLDGEDVIEAQPDQASLTLRYAQRCVEFLREAKDQPFLLYLAHMHVHLPLYVPERFLAASQNGRYGAAVECVDWVTGVLMYELKQLGLEQNTLVLFTSDNGSRCDFGPSNGVLRGKKGSTWEGGFRTPLLATWPGVVPPGTTCRTPVSGTDLFPTLAEFAGAAVPNDREIDGRSIAALLRGDSTNTPARPILYYHGDYLDALRLGRWKLHVGRRSWTESQTGLCELYDMELDPAESHECSSQKGEVVRDLMNLIDQYRLNLGDAAVASEGANCRPIGRVSDPRPLTTFDLDCPYYQATYDLTDAG